MAIYAFTYQSTSSGGVIYDNTLHYVTQPPLEGSEPAAADVLSVIDTALRTSYKACLNTQVTLLSATLSERVQPGSGDVPVGAALEIGDAGTGPTYDGKVSPALCCIIQLKTGVPLRSARGYLAMPSPEASTAMASSSKFTGTYLTGLDAFAAKLDDDYEIGTVSVTSVIPVVYSRTRHARGQNPPWFQVEAGVVRNAQRWRRSRLSVP